ncbi:unnamed protein product [Cyprideis torosa]|uniref:Uncharacterized protein n=1 Tax=Cyprideis torosa TaxID=163714 RepID=A0A7R8WQY3_9CRUS|nr:unnamed protein product [Cyprideis torosa]CAG0908327.1 unnamed protein product [Cyprideis torosa]
MGLFLNSVSTASFLILFGPQTLAYDQKASNLLLSEPKGQVDYSPDGPTWEHNNMAASMDEYSCRIVGSFYIPDGYSIDISLVCTDQCLTISEMELNYFSLQHEFSADLEILLRYNNNMAATIKTTNNQCLSFAYHEITVKDDTDGGPQLDLACPQDGFILTSPPSYKPRTSFANAFNGLDSCGNWTLTVFDRYIQDEGVVTSIGLLFRGQG